VSEAAGGFAYNLGLRSSPPALSRHSYIEKVEYWALVWGGVVMVLTGVVLWANGLALVWLPKSALDVGTAIHLYEAILATLAVLVWHFYFVIFDPEVYPLNTALLTGYSPGTEASKPSEVSEIPQETVVKT
jgi:cytochrome b subunit of formate dehydrogenase